jgi:hypothetical protein
MNDEMKKVSAVVASVRATQVPVGAIAPRTESRRPHPMDAVHTEGQRLQHKLYELSLQFNLAQKQASRIVRPEPGWWCAYRGCQGEVEVSGRNGVCNLCKRATDIFHDPHVRPRLRLPEIVLIPEGVAEVIRLRKATEKVEREIEAWKKSRAQAEVELMDKTFGNRPGPPSPYIQTWK